MPGGLSGVEQVFTADASGYVAEIQAMIKANQGLVQSVAEAKRAVGDTGRASGGGGAADDIAKTNAAIRDQLKTLGDYSQVVRDVAAATTEMGRVHTQVTGTVGGHADSVSALAASYEAARARVNAMAADALRANADMAAGFERVRSAGTASGESVRSVTTEVGRLRDTAKDANNRLADTAAALTAVRSAGGGSSSSSAGPSLTEIGRMMDQRIQAEGFSTYRDAMAAAGLGPSGGGGGSGSGGGGVIPVSAPSGGGGGGGGYGPSGSGAFVPWRGGGFQAIKFWGMAIGEFAATAVPALMAAGAASAVGMKGAEDVIVRARALSTTVNALGPAYGVTMGSVLGTSGALGKAQAAARGGVYELAGAGIDFAKMGGGQFSQMGVNTLAMIDRGTANMLINYQNRQAAGKGGAGLLSGGTEWLRRYGDLGANIGDTLMNLAPYEPGIGGDVLNTLVGGTGFLKQMTQDIPGPLLGGLMAAEGGMRWGKAILGGKGLLGRVLGLGKVGGVGGLLGKAGEGLGIEGLTGLGEGLAAGAGPISLAAALSAYGLSELASTMPSPAQRQVAALQAGVSNAGFTGAWQPLAHAIMKTTGLAASVPVGPGSDMMGTNQSPGSFMRFGQIGPTTRQVYEGAATGFAQTMGDLANAGPQLVGALKKAGLKSVNMADAFQIAQNALVDVSHAFGPDGKLTQTALQMVTHYVAGTPGFAKMTGVSGAFVAADAAQTIMSRPEMKSLSQVNQAMDSMTQIMTGGPAGMATLFGMLGGTPTTVSHGGMKLAPPPAIAQMAKALTSFTSASGASAWNTFAGSQGLVAAEQGNLDQLRTYLTLGSMNQKQAGGVAGFQLQQLLPMAQKSPAALAMLMQQSAQMGIGGYYQGDPNKPGVQAANYENAKKALASMADSSKQVSKDMNSAVVKASDLPATANQFMQGITANIQAQHIAQASKDLTKIKQAAAAEPDGKYGGGTFGPVGGAALKDLVAQMRAAGVQGGAALRSSIDAALKQAGVGKAERIKIEAQITGTGQLKTLQQMVDSLHDKHVNVAVYANAHPVQTLQAAMSGLTNKTVTVTVREVHDYINIVHNQLGVPTSVAAGVAPGYLLSHGHFGGLVTARGIARYQTGGMVPGSGQGDIIPAMLEPGEAIIPRYLVPLIAPILAAHRVPGFGGMPQSSSSHFAAGGVAGSGSHPWLPYWEYEAKKKGWSPPAAHHATGGGTSAVTDAAKNFTFTLTGEIARQVQNSAGAKKIADELIARIGKEVALAKNVSSAAMQGQGYGNAGLLGGFDVTPGTGGGTVLEQMQSYLGSVKSFTKDIATLRKDHLNKALISQLVAAGPVQGDALAQSIMNDYGGVKGVNSVWGQLGGATKGLGAQAAMAQYGGTIAPNLKSGSVSIGGINISINAGSGATLSLSDAQIKAVVAKVQAALLKQAKRNNKTGLQLPTKGA